MRRVSLFTVGGCLLLSSTLSIGQEKPLAPWGIYTLVSTGHRTYDVLRYDLVSSSVTLRCRVDGIESRAPETTCTSG